MLSLGHPRSRGPQRADDRRRLRARRARADADLRRPAHHQFRARRAADRCDVRGVLRAQAARASIPIVAALVLAPLFFALGYALQRFIIGPAAHGEDRNILLVTLGLAVVIENALLYAFRADTRTDRPALRFQTSSSSARLPRGAARRSPSSWSSPLRWRSGSSCVDRYRQGDPRRRQGEARRRARRHRCRAHLCDDLRARHRLPRHRRLPADADLLRQSAAPETPSCSSPSPSSCSAAWARSPGALIGGLIIGVVESLGGLYLGESLGQIGIFLIFILVLLLRPRGLFGERA